MKIKLDSVDLFYKKSGNGTPLLFLHGNGEDHSIFDMLSEKLQSHFMVYAIDSRNHGQSSKTNDFSYQTMTQDIYQFVKTLDLHDVAVVGFSDGAIIATMLELEHPNTFSKMVLLGINLKPSDFKEGNLEYLSAEYQKTKDPLLKLMLEEPNIELESLKTIITPTLVVRAGDELFDDSLYTDIVNTMPDAQLLIMENHSHDSYVVNSDILFSHLIDFLK